MENYVKDQFTKKKKKKISSLILYHSDVTSFDWQFYPKQLTIDTGQQRFSRLYTGLTPFQCVLGCQPPVFPWLRKLTEVPVVNRRSKETTIMQLHWTIWWQKIQVDERQHPHPLLHPSTYILNYCQVSHIFSVHFNILRQIYPIPRTGVGPNRGGSALGVAKRLVFPAS